MPSHLILTITSDDKPGVIESVSSAIESCGGNWLESKLAHLGGKFVGVVRVSIEESEQDSLTSAIAKLRDKNITINAEASNDEISSEAAEQASFSAVGPDRTGIIKELSRAFSRYDINVEELDSKLSSMPYSGEPIFEAVGRISLPAGIDVRDLHDKLNAIANDLGIDIDLGSF